MTFIIVVWDIMSVMLPKFTLMMSKLLYSILQKAILSDVNSCKQILTARRWVTEICYPSQYHVTEGQTTGMQEMDVY